MSKARLQQLLAGLVIAALVVTSIATAAMAAPVQQVRAQTVTGTIPGGQFAEIWLGMEIIQPGQTTVTATWDRSDLGGIGFFILNAENVASVTSGGRARDNNVAAGSQVEAFRGAPNQQEASIRATSTDYTLVVFNESQQDAIFTLTADNAYITDGSGNVTDPNAVVVDEDAADGEDATDDEAATDEATTDEAAADEAAADEAATDDAAADDVAVDAAAPVAATIDATDAVTSTTPADATAVNSSGVVKAGELEGELPEQDDQHYLGLEVAERDGSITLSLTYDPQDSTELARRLNFWVLDERGFEQYQGGDSLSKIAIAAGSSNVDTAANERVANFKAVGFGPYTVIVYNSSNIPATYTLAVSGGTLVDDSGQTLTAQEAVAVAPVADEEEADTDTATTDASDTDTAAPDADDSATAATGREGEPGGTYTIQSGDSMSLIARDIYGDIQLYDEICAFNNIDNCDSIEVGDVIQLPTTAQIGSGATAPAATNAAVSPLPTPTASAAVTTTAALTDTVALTDTDTVTSTSTIGSGALLDILAADGRFKTLLAALDAADLVDTLGGDGPFTILAPTDAAFAALPTGALAELRTQLESNPTGQLYQILLYHVADGQLLSADLEDGLEVQTKQGNTVKFELADDGSVTVNGANVSDADIVANNGIIHAIDAVILPPLQ